MKRAIVFVVLLAAIALVLVSCGGNSSSNTQQQVSGLKSRAFVSNTFAGALDIVDYKKNQQSFSVISAGSSPQFMVLSDDKTLTMVFDAGNNSITIVNNKNEQSAGSIALPDWTDSMDISPDSKTAYAAIRNAPVTGAPTGTVWVVDLTTGQAGTAINIPLVRRLALNPAGTFMVAISDGPVPNAPQGQISIIDTAKKQVTSTISTGVDRPIQGIFSTDGTKAYIVNCGAECGGTEASITVLDMTTGQMVPGAKAVVTAGTTALLDGSNLYVAGTVPGVGGVLTTVTVNGSTVSTGTTTAIGDGFHTLMGKGSNNKLFIGANPCTNSGNAGCLSIFDTTTRKAVVDQAKGYVTGMDAVPNSKDMYVVEGGELRVYDTTTSAEMVGILIDIFGEVSDVKVIDK